MIIEDGLKEIDYVGETAVAIGKFDGVHAGHQKLIKECTKDKSLKSVVFTFSFASEYFGGNRERILSDENRHKKFEELGVDYLIEYNLTQALSHMSPEEFVREVLKKRLHCKKIVCGPDLTFGYKGMGTVDTLKALEKELSIEVCVIEKVKYQGEDISSTRIREAIKTGHVTDADNMMTGQGGDLQ